MQIKQINDSKNLSTNGYIKIKGAKNALSLRDAISNSKYFNNIAKTNDVVTRISYIIPKDEKKDIVFKIKYSILKENSFVDKVLDLLNLKSRKEYNNEYSDVRDLITLLKQ